jgi:long-chain acyl-CoA synthetase
MTPVEGGFPQQPIRTVRQMLERSLSARGDCPAIIDGSGILTYSSLVKSILRIEERLRSAGIGKGDCIAVDCDGRDLIILTFAVMYSGACAVAVPRQCTERERDALFDHCAVTTFISKEETRFFPQLCGEIRAEDLTDVFLLFRRPSPPSSSFLSGAVGDAAFIRFTSGTTGKSKGVLFGERSLVERVMAANKSLAVCEGDVVLWVLPMAYHFIVSIMLYLYAGACILIPENNLPESVRSAIRLNRVKMLYANEHFFKSLISHCSEDDLKSVRKALSTSVSLSQKVAADFDSKFGVPISQAYGIIEVGLPFVNVEKPREKAGSVGRILPDYQVKVVNDKGERVGPGAVGEIYLRGPGLFDAYLSPFRKREEVCSDGWFHTGDMGSLDEEEYLHLTGRRGEVINCMGMKIFPSEIEEVLNQHPGIKASLVKAIPHPYLKEVPHAVIVPCDKDRQPDAGELISFCGLYLSAYKIPRSFEFVESLPETGSGKIRRIQS